MSQTTPSQLESVQKVHLNRINTVVESVKWTGFVDHFASQILNFVLYFGEGTFATPNPFVLTYKVCLNQL